MLYTRYNTHDAHHFEKRKKFFLMLYTRYDIHDAKLFQKE